MNIKMFIQGLICVLIGLGLAYIFIFIWPPAYSLDWYANIWRIAFFVLGLIFLLLGWVYVTNAAKMTAYDYLDLKYIPGFLGILFWRLVGVWLMLSGVGLTVGCAKWIYAFWIERTAGWILILTPILGILAGVIMVGGGVVLTVGGLKAFK